MNSGSIVFDAVRVIPGGLSDQHPFQLRRKREQARTRGRKHPGYDLVGSQLLSAVLSCCSYSLGWYWLGKVDGAFWLAVSRAFASWVFHGYAQELLFL